MSDYSFNIILLFLNSALFVIVPGFFVAFDLLPSICGNIIERKKHYPLSAAVLVLICLAAPIYFRYTLYFPLFFLLYFIFFRFIKKIAGFNPFYRLYIYVLLCLLMILFKILFFMIAGFKLSLPAVELLLVNLLLNFLFLEITKKTRERGEHTTF